MNIRDDEIKRLIQYAKSLGLTVAWKEHKRGDPGATWLQTDNVPVGIEMFVYKGQSKISIILTLLHELAHHLEFVYNGRKDSPELIEALYQADNKHTVVSKAQRKLIFETEKAACPYRELIANELGLKIPMYKLKADIDLDIWIYKHYYLTGKLPTNNEIALQKRLFYTYYKEIYHDKKTS